MIRSRLFQSARTLGREAYFRLASLNYSHELYARRNRTPCGTVRCYEPLNRHGNDRMLADVAHESGPSAVIYDVGANVGIYALSLAVGRPERSILAVEPGPATVEHLRSNVGANGLGDRIQIRHAGLGASTGQRRFYVSTLPELSGFDRRSATRWGATVAGTEQVSVETLDSLVRSNREPDVVKLDVEGAGPAVLSGGTRTLAEIRPALYVEIHESMGADRVDRMAARLDEHGYAIEDRDGYWRCTPG